ncbi:lysophospholipid acyltransferase family protein [Ralstonia pseudosolanacearum]|uniref:lysophospholipid acyltransferase family protein n=1 Tax=Ralstonia pseudosolanacearum TaxID=1310165 RepID=UPI003866ACBC
MASRLKTALNRGWRLLATGFGFLVFGVCGLLFSVAVFPLVWLWPHRASRQRAVTTVIHRFFQALVRMLDWLGVMTLEVQGASALRSGEPAIVVANHPTYLDVMVLLSLTPSACCVVKNAHWSNPCFWGIVRAAEYVSNADPTALVEAGARQLAAGYTMIIFPEGTRSPGQDRLHPFSRGFAHMALSAAVPIVPVLMDCDPPAFTKTMRWYHIPPRRMRMRIAVLDPIRIRQYAAPDTPPAVAARTLTAGVETQITDHLYQYGFFKARN